MLHELGRHWLAAAAVLCAAALSGCASSVVLKSETLEVRQAIRTGAPEEYRLQAGDRVSAIYTTHEGPEGPEPYTINASDVIAVNVQDRVFGWVTRGAATAVLTVMSLVGVFLLIKGFPALSAAGPRFLSTEAWEPNSGTFGIAAVLAGTVFIALTAIVVAIPLAIGTALYISEYAPARIKQALISVIDLMAAIPSVVYGLWGLFLLQPSILDFAQWIATYLGWIPLFAVTNFDSNDPLTSATVFTASTFVAGLVVAMMVAPIVSSIMREVFTQAPIGEREGALALGATRWGMIRSVVLPFGRGGMIGGTMLGLGRALGETIAVYLIISPVFVIQPHILEISALMGAGLVLFLMTLLVNFGASFIIATSRSGASSDG